MRGLWLLVAVLLSLLPSPAAACERAPVSGGEHSLAAPGADFGDQVRGGTGFEILTQQGRAEGRSPRDLCPDPLVRQPPAARRLASPVRGDPRPAPAGSTPLCERLPYHATAPPHRG